MHASLYIAPSAERGKRAQNGGTVTGIALICRRRSYSMRALAKGANNADELPKFGAGSPCGCERYGGRLIEQCERSQLGNRDGLLRALER